MACLHTHMFATCRITCLSIKRYQFTGCDMPLQKSSGVAILVSLQECGFFGLEPCTGPPTLESHRSKLGLRSTSSNAIKRQLLLSRRVTRPKIKQLAGLQDATKNNITWNTNRYRTEKRRVRDEKGFSCNLLAMPFDWSKRLATTKTEKVSTSLQRC